MDLTPDVLIVSAGRGKGGGGFLNAYIQTPADVGPMDVDVPSVTLSVGGTPIASAELIAIVGRVLHVRFPLTLQDVALITGLNVTGVSVSDASVRVKASSLPTEPIRLVEVGLSGALLTGGQIVGQDVLRVMSE